MDINDMLNNDRDWTDSHRNGDDEDDEIEVQLNQIGDLMFNPPEYNRRIQLIFAQSQLRRAKDLVARIQANLGDAISQLESRQAEVRQLEGGRATN